MLILENLFRKGGSSRPLRKILPEIEVNRVEYRLQKLLPEVKVNRVEYRNYYLR